MRRMILPIVLAVALIATGTWGYNQYTQNRQYGIHMDNIYQKSFYELVGNVGNVESRLGKLMVSGDKSQHMMLLSEICRQANAAQNDLGQLPVSHHALMKTSKYLNQLSDYTYFLSKKVANGQTLSVEEIDNLRKLHENSLRLNRDLVDLDNDIQSGGVRWGELRLKAKEGFHDASDNIVTEQFVKIERTSIDYPALIYDGPFSEALEDRENVNLKGAMITQKQAESIAADFVGRDRIESVTDAGQVNGDIEAWGVNILTKGNNGSVYISVTKKGGKVLNMIADRAPREARLSISEVKKQAEKFLDDKGYSNMVPTYEQHFDGVAIINFAYKENDVVMYPDLIKVKISLEDAKILGFEARNFLVAHKDRNLDEPKLTMEEAKKLVSPNLDVKAEQLAIIPMESKKERLCYEFKGEYEGATFIVYIDANTGEEADILQVIHTENGSLTV